jgi:hypothetical protein
MLIGVIGHCKEKKMSNIEKILDEAPCPLNEEQMSFIKQLLQQQLAKKEARIAKAVEILEERTVGTFYEWQNELIDKAIQALQEPCPKCGGHPRGIPAKDGGWTTCDCQKGSEEGKQVIQARIAKAVEFIKGIRESLNQATGITNVLIELDDFIQALLSKPCKNPARSTGELNENS